MPLPDTQHTTLPAIQLTQGDTTPENVTLATLKYGAIGAITGAVIGGVGSSIDYWRNSTALAGAAIFGIIAGYMGMRSAEKENHWVRSAKHYMQLDKAGELRPNHILSEDKEYLEKKSPSAAAWAAGLTNGLIWGGIDLLALPFIPKNERPQFLVCSLLQGATIGGAEAMHAYEETERHNHRGEVLASFIQRARFYEQQAKSQSHTERLADERTQPLMPASVRPR